MSEWINSLTFDTIFICFMLSLIPISIIMYFLSSALVKRKEKKMHLRYPEYYEMTEQYNKYSEEEVWNGIHREADIKKEIDFRVGDFHYRTKADQDICTQELEMYRHKLKDARKDLEEKQFKLRSMGQKIDHYLLKHPELLKYVEYSSWENPGESLKED